MAIRQRIDFGRVAPGFIVTYDKAVIYIRVDAVAASILIVPGQKRKIPIARHTEVVKEEAGSARYYGKGKISKVRW